MAPRLARRKELRERLRALEADVTAQRRALYAIRDDDSFSASVARREAEDTLVAWECKAVAVEAELRSVLVEIEAVQDRLRAELTPHLAAEGLAVLVALLDGLERLSAAAEGYRRYGQRCKQLLGSELTYEQLAFAFLPHYIQQVQLHYRTLFTKSL
jgi:hypothetical protein